MNKELPKPAQFAFRPFTAPPTDASKANWDPFGEYKEHKENRYKFTQEDLDNAREEGKKAGQALGVKEGEERGRGERMALDKAILREFSVIAAQLDGFNRVLEAAIESKMQDTIRLAGLIAEKVAKDALKENPLPAIERMVRDAQKIIFSERSVRIMVHPSIAEPMQEMLTRLCTEHNAPYPVKVLGDKALDVGSCRIDWDQGGLELDQSAAWQEIHTLLGIGPEHSAPKQAAPVDNSVPEAPKDAPKSE